MTIRQSLAVAAMLLGSTSLAFAQGPGIAPNGMNLPPQSAYGLNGYGLGYGSNANQFYNYAPDYHRYSYVRPYAVHRRRHYSH